MQGDCFSAGIAGPRRGRAARWHPVAVTHASEASGPMPYLVEARPDTAAFAGPRGGRGCSAAVRGRPEGGAVAGVEA